MTNKEKFHAALLDAMQADPPPPFTVFSNVGQRVHNPGTPAELAEKFARGLLDGTAANDGPRVKRACKACGIKTTYKAIREYCADV